MKKKSILLCGLVASQILFTSTAFTAEDEKKKKKAAKTPEMQMKKMDTDKDGKISETEFLAKAKNDEIKAKMQKGFKMMDKDQDGFISMEELKARAAKGKKDKNKKEEA